MFLRKKAYKWHRLLSAIATVPFTMWAGSAVLHQANAWFKPAFEKAPYEMRLSGSDYEQTTILVKARYQSDAKVENIQKIETFNLGYSAKNKVLPVFQATMASANQTILYVDLRGKRIISGSTQTSRGIHKWFGYLHKWDFLKPWPSIRATGIIFFSLITLLAGWLGVYLYFLLPFFRTRKQIHPTQKEKLWHRRIGICVSVFMILFAVTGLMHAVSDVYPAIESTVKPVFDQLHMYRFTADLGQQFRFWWLFGIAASFVLLVLSGLILFFRLFARRL
ncbi:PepSY domain-containing protein [Paradesertivirga mongoliensis]|uniref:PepSY domain-containing protein n=1 Tax=Paradesertivirga mongoliensis TaxID=2100740 RepID=A0ABW4ZQJ0_9SPHI|nr:PepSY domain-containing protein [Pedobacter mongoliensis]